MSDGLPTEEQLRRIERGVRDRIGRRGRIVRSVAGTTTAVVLVVGGIALLGSQALRSGGAGAGSAASSGRSTSFEVRCHAGSTRTSSAVLAKSAGDDPASLEAACNSTVEFQSGSGRMPSTSPSARGQAAPASPSRPSDLTSGTYSAPRPAVACRAANGDLHVFPADGRSATLCVRNGMTAL